MLNLQIRSSSSTVDRNFIVQMLFKNSRCAYSFLFSVLLYLAVFCLAILMNELDNFIVTHSNKFDNVDRDLW